MQPWSNACSISHQGIIPTHPLQVQCWYQRTGCTDAETKCSVRLWKWCRFLFIICLFSFLLSLISLTVFTLASQLPIKQHNLWTAHMQLWVQGMAHKVDVAIVMMIVSILQWPSFCQLNSKETIHTKKDWKILIWRGTIMKRQKVYNLHVILHSHSLDCLFIVTSAL